MLMVHFCNPYPCCSHSSISVIGPNFELPVNSLQTQAPLTYLLLVLIVGCSTQRLTDRLRLLMPFALPVRLPVALATSWHCCSYDGQPAVPDSSGVPCPCQPEIMLIFMLRSG